MSYLEQFTQQWKDYLKSQLLAEGLKYIEIDERKDVELRKNSLNYFNWLRRIPRAKPRSIKLATQFHVPPEHQEDFRRFCEIVTKGGSLEGFCSRENIKKDKEAVRDPIFDDWGIHHFHFKETGTHEVIFAVVEPETIYCLMVKKHGGVPSPWLDKNLLESLHSNFPNIIAHLKLGNCSPQKATSEEDHRSARKVRRNLPIILSDGVQYYPTGEGVAMDNGTHKDNRAWMALDRQLRDLADRAEEETLSLAKQLNVDMNAIQIFLAFSYDDEQNIFIVSW